MSLRTVLSAGSYMSLVTVPSAGNTLKEGAAVTILRCSAFNRVGIVLRSVTVIMTKGALLN